MDNCDDTKKKESPRHIKLKERRSIEDTFLCKASNLNMHTIVALDINKD